MKKLNKRNFLSIKARLWLRTNAYKTNQKIVVIESDDWGSIRTSDKSILNVLKNNNYDIKSSPYLFDCLESEEDLEMLYSLLAKFQFRNGYTPIFTANIIMGNPDFSKIEASNFNEYHYESVQKTCERYGEGYQIVEKWLEGYDKKLFFPQLHGREHIRYWEWLRDLKNKNEETLLTFQYNMCGVPLATSKENMSYFKPLYISSDRLKENGVSLEKLILDGCEMFKHTFGFDSYTTVAPNVAWTPETETVWNNCNIRTIQGGFLQELHDAGKVGYIPRFTGQKNKFNQLYLVRNCTFEPSKSNDDNYWKNTFHQVERAFKIKTPAIISTHRVNYVGGIKQENRTFGLKQLESLLSAIQSKYPDTVFLTSEELSKKITGEQ